MRLRRAAAGVLRQFRSPRPSRLNQSPLPGAVSRRTPKPATQSVKDSDAIQRRGPVADVPTAPEGGEYILQAFGMPGKLKKFFQAPEELPASKRPAAESSRPQQPFFFKTPPAKPSKQPIFVPETVRQRCERTLENDIRILFSQSRFALPHGRFSHLELGPNLKTAAVIWLLEGEVENRAVVMDYFDRQSQAMRRSLRREGGRKIPKLKLVVDLSEVTMADLMSVEEELNERREQLQG